MARGGRVDLGTTGRRRARLDFDNVHVAECKLAHHLKDRALLVRKRQYDARLVVRSISMPRGGIKLHQTLLVAAYDQVAGLSVAVVGDTGREDLEPVQHRRLAWGHCRRGEGVGRSVLQLLFQVRARGRAVHGSHALRDLVPVGEGVEEDRARVHNLGVAADPLHLGELLHALTRHEAILLHHADLADNVQRVCQEQVIDVVERAAVRVLDGHDAVLRLPLLDRLEESVVGAHPLHRAREGGSPREVSKRRLLRETSLGAHVDTERAPFARPFARANALLLLRRLGGCHGA
mmetsp:Transcript_16634/g.43547  ORF Transcript_16634/g.43547 Transcript_16634/m.43547 type:complete len:291 (-) Transcript_16634:15-887(-)